MTLKNVNVSNLLHTIVQLQTEVKALTQASKVQKEVTDDVLDLTKSLDVRVSKIETPNHSVKSVPEKNATTVVPVVDGSTAPRRDASRVVPAVEGLAAAAPAAAPRGTSTPLNPGAVPFIAPVEPEPMTSYATVMRLNNARNPTSNVVADAHGFITVGRGGKPVKPVSNVQKRNPLTKKRSQGMVGSSTRSGITAATRFTKSSVFVTRYPPCFTAKGVKDDLLLDDRVKHLDINVEQVQT